MLNLVTLLEQDSNPMKKSLNQASKDTGVSLPTLSRWRKNGLISAERAEGGGYLIDTSEYSRINELRAQSPKMQGAMKSNMLNLVTEKQPIETQQKSPLLELENEMLRQRLAEMSLLLEDLKSERNDWKKQAQTLLLQVNTNAEPQKTPVEAHKNFLARLLSKIA
jgi:DNA-binding transcriptional MerR regulator